jgi:SAM-dependent methyltransferase
MTTPDEAESGDSRTSSSVGDSRNFSSVGDSRNFSSVGDSRTSSGAANAVGQVAAPPGGPLLAVAKRGAEHLLWARVALQRRAEARRGYAANRPLPTSVRPTAVLSTTGDWEQAVAEARRLRLPLHRDLPKNWDALGAVGAVLSMADDGSRTARVMDAGSARYSPVLPWLRLYGLGDEADSLLGTNLEFGDEVRRDGVTFRHGDVTATGLPDDSLDAITCMSVIEHGVPIEAFLRESARVLRPGGILCVSTDYDQEPPDTTGRTAYGSEVRIFGPEDIRGLLAAADEVGLDLVGDLSTSDALSHEERPVHWDRVGLDYTFILLTFRRR